MPCAQSLGWVEQAACRPYTASAADSALVSVMPEVAAGGYCPGEDSASHAVCARALKLAAQYQNVNDLQQVCVGFVLGHPMSAMLMLVSTCITSLTRYTLRAIGLELYACRIEHNSDWCDVHSSHCLVFVVYAGCSCVCCQLPCLGSDDMQHAVRLPQICIRITMLSNFAAFQL